MAKEKSQPRPMHGPGSQRVVQKPKSMKKAFKTLMRYLSPHKYVFLVVIVFASLSAVFNILGPRYLGKITNEVQIGIFTNSPINFDRIYQIMWLLIALYIISYIFNVLQGIIITRLTQKLTKQMRTDLFRKMERIPLKYFDKNAHGDTLSRMTNDIDLIGQALNSSVTQFFTSITLLIGVLVMMFIISWQLALIAIVSLPLSGVILRFIMKKSQKFFVKQQKTLGALNGHIEEAYTGQQILKAYQAEAKFLNVFEQHNDDLYETSWKSQFISGLMFPIMNFVGNLSYLFVAVIGGILAVGGGLLIGDIQSMLQYVRQFNQPLGTIAQSLTQVQSALAATERVFEFLNEEEMEVEEETKFIESVKGSVEFKHVKFGYDEDKEIIHDFSLVVKPGQKVAIVGPTGAGKTTLVNLLMRFYEINSGDILVDGISTRRMSRNEVHKLFGMVLQDTWLFHGTIKENLKYGHLEATDEEIIKAAKTANVHHFIKSLSHGYDHELGENSSISQGQQQLLTIARAMVTDAPMLILDEATSSVDVRTEMLIQEAMDSLMKDRTTFVIAHRLSTIKNADIILVLNEGNVVETGTHQALLDQKGFYADLYNSQFEL
ncbi:ABC transporter ATP-binding protein [Mariniplasma anaerobium]|uniref:ABC transporter n=1 Tax=Mariniplasma anaerobium TaxID=2735436 RepID=A0A7U9TII9_9MOLU|nr:ABC transporter transmembrane domain-containing protein [Mariniplasma anaerobium]BCR35873.1 ABC transporter [Mariniplasma anaerobium]